MCVIIATDRHCNFNLGFSMNYICILKYLVDVIAGVAQLV
jgi:hypothetical protein